MQIKRPLELTDATLDSAEKDSRAPLLQAAQPGHPGAAEMLLEQWDVTPDTGDKG